MAKVDKPNINIYTVAERRSNVPPLSPPPLFLQRKSVPLFEETPESITNVANRGGGYEVPLLPCDLPSE